MEKKLTINSNHFVTQVIGQNILLITIGKNFHNRILNLQLVKKQMLIKIILPLFLIVIFFQLFYIFNIVILTFFKKINKKDKNKRTEENKQIKRYFKKISIIIPVFNSEQTIDSCLNAILQNDLSLIEKVIIVLDHCTDASAKIVSFNIKKFKKHRLDYKIINLDYGKTGKVEAIKQGVNFIKTKNVLLLDADIILKRDAIEKLLFFHLNNNNLYSSCLVYPHQQKMGNKLVSQIISHDRLYRQNILKMVKNEYNVANFPGALQIVNLERYKKFLVTGFLEDLKATFGVIGTKNKISILPEVLAYEIERKSLKGLFFQRIRWTIGNIENIPLFIKAVISENNFLKKILISSYPILWYIQHYVIVIGIFLIILLGLKIFLLIPLFLYFSQISLSAILGGSEHKSNIIGLIAHCMIFPFIITMAFIGAITMIIINKKFYFKNNILFSRN